MGGGCRTLRFSGCGFCIFGPARRVLSTLSQSFELPTKLTLTASTVCVILSYTFTWRRKERIPLSATSPSSLLAVHPSLSISSAPLSHYLPNCLQLNLFAHPHPLNPVVSILYKNIGGRGPLLRQTPNFPLSTSFIHPLYFLHLTHSFPQRALHNPFGINPLRILFVATGVYPPLGTLICSVAIPLPSPSL